MFITTIFIITAGCTVIPLDVGLVRWPARLSR